MTAKAKATKTPIVISAPKLTSAWVSLCSTTTKSDSANSAAIEKLATEIKNSALSIRDVQKVIKESGQVSSLVKISHIEGLTTWLVLRKDKEFLALDLDKQLSSAVSAYKLLGVKTAQGLSTFADVSKATTDARKVKHEKAKAGTPVKATAKAKATNGQTLAEIIKYISALDLETLTDAEHDTFAELCVLVDAKAEAFNLA
jgi:hypothetical protein